MDIKTNEETYHGKTGETKSKNKDKSLIVLFDHFPIFLFFGFFFNWPLSNFSFRCGYGYSSCKNKSFTGHIYSCLGY